MTTEEPATVPLPSEDQIKTARVQSRTVEAGFARLIALAEDGDVSLEWSARTGFHVTIRKNRSRRLFVPGRSATEAVWKAIDIMVKR